MAFCSVRLSSFQNNKTSIFVLAESMASHLPTRNAFGKSVLLVVKTSASVCKACKDLKYSGVKNFSRFCRFSGENRISYAVFCLKKKNTTPRDAVHSGA